MRRAVIPNGMMVVMRCSMLPALTAGVVLMTIGVGCSASGRSLRSAPPAALSEPTPVGEWESVARPDGLHVIASFIALVGAAEPSECPVVERSEQVTVLRGGCTDASGERHHGWARVITTDDGARVRLRGFGDSEGRATGRVRVWAEPRARFDIDLVVEPGLHHGENLPAPAWTAIDAKGSRDEHGAWNGEGRLASEGRGMVRMKARGIVLDDRCSHEPLRGTLELSTKEHTVLVTYDGDVDCDAEGTARWSLDGVDQGELEGIDGGLSCESSEGGGEVPVSGAMVLLVGMRRRRRRG